GELRPTQTFHEVPPPDPSGFLHRPQNAVDAAQPAPERLDLSRLTRDDAVPLEERRRPGVGALGAGHVIEHQVADERPPPPDAATARARLSPPAAREPAAPGGAGFLGRLAIRDRPSSALESPGARRAGVARPERAKRGEGVVRHQPG